MSSSDCADALDKFLNGFRYAVRPALDPSAELTNFHRAQWLVVRTLQSSVNDHPIGSSTYSMPWENSRLLR
jgi:hypothetical protein